MATGLCNRLGSLDAKTLAKLDEENLRTLLRLIRAERYQKIDALCRQEVASFDAGPLLWLTRFTKTENPQYEEQGRPFLAGFPRKGYFVPLFQAFLDNLPMLAIIKSRTMMTSWAAAGFSTWAAMWKNEETVIQTINIDRALHIIDYVRQLAKYQDPELSELHPIEKATAFTILWKGGGEVSAIPSGADAIRAFHPTRYIQEESAFMAEGEQALNAVMPTGAKIICISTAQAGWYGDMCESK
jgi:hypothetical protein